MDEFDDLVNEGLKQADLKIIRPVDLQGLSIPQRKWVVDNWIPVGHVTAIYGDGGTGKSLLAQMLMTDVALGTRFLKLETKQCKVLGVFCEDDEDELHRRQAQILQNYSAEFFDLNNMQYMSRVGEDNLLMTFKGDNTSQLTTFFHQIEKAAKDFGAELIIIDTAADTFGGNENVRPQVRQYLSSCLTRLARSINGTIVVCAHPSVAGIASKDGYGGSTAWSNSVRSRLYLSRVDKKEDEDSGQQITKNEMLESSPKKKQTIAQ